MTTPAERWPDPFAPATSTDDYDPWAVEVDHIFYSGGHWYSRPAGARFALGPRTHLADRCCADCEHERTHLEVRHGTTDQRRYVEICDDCTVQLREVDA